MSEFLHMGGYAVYVWSSYALAAVILLANLLIPHLRLKRIIRDLARRANARRKSL